MNHQTTHPMRCISCQSQFTASDGLCPHCGFNHHVELQASSAMLTVVKPKTRLQVDLTLAICTDRTGSSTAFSQGITMMHRAFVEPIAQKVAGLTLWHQTHGDRESDEQEIMITDGTREVARYLADAGRISFAGGGDAEETHLDGVEAILRRVPWPPPADKSRRGALVVFVNADSKPTRSGVTAAELGARVRQLGILLYVVSDEEYPCWKELVSTAGGVLLPLTNDPRIEDCQQVAAKLGQSVEMTVASGARMPLLQAGMKTEAMTRTQPMRIAGQ